LTHDKLLSDFVFLSASAEAPTSAESAGPFSVRAYIGAHIEVSPFRATSRLHRGLAVALHR